MKSMQFVLQIIKTLLLDLHGYILDGKLSKRLFNL